MPALLTRRKRRHIRLLERFLQCLAFEAMFPFQYVAQVRRIIQMAERQLDGLSLAGPMNPGEMLEEILELLEEPRSRPFYQFSTHLTF
jgi:hypothetical protein